MKEKIVIPQRRVPVDAQKPLSFKITRASIVLAKCKDPTKCVVAQAMMALFGDIFDGIEVGSSITKLYIPGKEIRYSTPSSLKRAIVIFDNTGLWNLPEGEYTLLPPSKTMRLNARPNRWNKVSVTKTAKGRDMFRRRALSSRQVKRAET